MIRGMERDERKQKNQRGEGESERERRDNRTSMLAGTYIHMRYMRCKESVKLHKLRF